MFSMNLSTFLKRVNEVLIRNSEYGCESNLTDEDMLKMQIDWALENGDKKRFMELSQQLRALG